jgi:hypothetical protein
MAPKKGGKWNGVSTSSKTPHEAKWDERCSERAFFDPGLNSTTVNLLHQFVCSKSNEHGATVPHPVGAWGLTSRQARVFSCFFRIGLVPPMSEFLLVVLRSYRLSLVLLHPNALLTMSIF